MPLREARILNFRAYDDSGILNTGPLTAVVGQNDCGKSGVLHALRIFFDPPKKGLADEDFHNKDVTQPARVELAFAPDELHSQDLRVDAKNSSHIVRDRLTDASGLFRVRVSVGPNRPEGFELHVQDVDDADLFPLCLKGHDELLALLANRGLQATKAGKETNQEKRTRLREAALEAGAALKEDWVDAKAVEKAVREILPRFVLFSDNARYGMAETGVQNQFKAIVERALEAHPTAQQIEADITSTIQAEFDKLYDRLQRLTDSVKGMQATANVSWKKAIDGIALLWTDFSGTELPYEMRGAGIRRLFMVAYLQYEAAESMHDVSGPKFVFAVEEPEVHLHPRAQRTLDGALRDLSSLGHTVVYTTHSPVFAASASPDTLMLVQRPSHAARIVQSPQLDLAMVAEELGVEASDRLVGKNNVVLVEGRLDVDFYRSVLSILKSAGITTLDVDRVLFLQCGGIANLRFMATARCIDEAGLKWGVVTDSDRQQLGGPLGVEAAKVKTMAPTSCAFVYTLERSSIENYLDATAVKAVTGIDCVIPPFGKATDLSGAPLSKTDWNVIKDSSAKIAKQMGAAGLLACSTTSTGTSEWVELAHALETSL